MGIRIASSLGLYLFFSTLSNGYLTTPKLSCLKQAFIMFMSLEVSWAALVWARLG